MIKLEIDKENVAIEMENTNEEELITLSKILTPKYFNQFLDRSKEEHK